MLLNGHLHAWRDEGFVLEKIPFQNKSKKKVYRTKIGEILSHTKGRSYRATFFPNFPLFFFQEKQEKQEQLETFPKFGNLTEGKLFGRVRIPIFGKRKENMEMQKNARKKYVEI